MRAIAILLLLVTSPLLMFPASAAADDLLDSKQPKKKPRKPTVQITISKETTHITKPLRADGYVDYVKALNQKASKGVTPKNNAAVLLWRAIGPSHVEKASSKEFYKLLGIEPLAAEGDYFISYDKYLDKQKPAATREELEKFRDEFDRAGQRLWSKKKYPLLVGWLAANEKPLRLVVEASRRSRYFSPSFPSFEDEYWPLMAIQYPSLHQVSSLTDALRTRAMLRAKAGRVDQAWSDLTACYRLARLIGVDPSGRAFGIERLTCRTATTLAQHGGLSAIAAARFAADLGKLPPLGGAADLLDSGERYIFLETAAMMAREGPHTIGRAVQIAVDEPASVALNRSITNLLVDWDQVTRTGNAWYDRMVAAARLPTRAERVKAMQSIAKEAQIAGVVATHLRHSNLTVAKRMILGESPREIASDFMGKILAALLVPISTQLVDLEDGTAARMEMTRIAFVLAAYKAENASYPAKLADLSPKYLAKVPVDIFSEGEFKYRIVKGGYRLWSVGPDGADDNGEGPDVEDYEGDGDDLLIATGK